MYIFIICIHLSSSMRATFYPGRFIAFATRDLSGLFFFLAVLLCGGTPDLYILMISNGILL